MQFVEENEVSNQIGYEVFKAEVHEIALFLYLKLRYFTRAQLHGLSQMTVHCIELGLRCTREMLDEI